MVAMLRSAVAMALARKPDGRGSAPGSYAEVLAERIQESQAELSARWLVALEAIRLTTWQAAWRIATGRRAATEVAIAKFWASEAAHRVTYAAQHLHGGIGVDVDYPLHRYYLWSKQIELTLGSQTRQLARIGAELAR